MSTTDIPKEVQDVLDKLDFYRNRGYSVDDEVMLRFHDDRRFSYWLIIGDRVFDTSFYIGEHSW